MNKTLRDWKKHIRSFPLKKTIVGACVAAVPFAAHADAVSIAYLVASWAASLGTAAGYWWAAAIIIATTVASNTDQRRKIRHARSDAINAYNASLKDIGVLQIVPDPDVREIYGEREVGGYVVAGFASDKTDYRDDGTVYTRPDALKHLVIVLAKGPIKSIGDVKIAGVSLGTLDANGRPTSGDYYKNRYHMPAQAVTGLDGTVIVPHVPHTIVGTAKYIREDGIVTLTAVNIPVTITPLGDGTARLTATEAELYIDYQYDASYGVIKITKYLGTETQTADPYLMSVSGGKWTANHRGLGWAYVVVTLDLEHEPFQAGIPALTFVCEGRMLYDPRKDSTNGGTGTHRYNNPATWGYDRNAALATSNFLFSKVGLAVDPATDINWASVITAANDSDIPTYVQSTTKAPGVLDGPFPKYVVDGVIASSDQLEGVLQDLSEAMGGFVAYGADWSLHAGVWHTPVATLNDSDLDGEISILQSGTAYEDLFNIVNGTYVESGTANPTDMLPYVNSTYVTVDGDPLTTDVTYPYTNYYPRAKQLARMDVEKNHRGLIIRYPGKLHLWPRAVGERVYVNSSEYGYVNKPFLIVDWEYGVVSPVTLILHEDEPEIYDDLDEFTPVSRNPPQLPDPNRVVALSNFQAFTGEQYTLRQPDGALIPRIKMTWDPVVDSYALYGGHIEIVWRVNDSTEKQSMRLQPKEIGAWITNASDNSLIHIEARVWNGFVHSELQSANIIVDAGSVPFVPVLDLFATYVGNLVPISWAPPVPLYWKRTEVRVGASWAVGTTIFNGLATAYNWNPTSPGTYTIWVKHFDTYGNEGAVATTTVNVVAPSMGSFSTSFNGPELVLVWTGNEGAFNIAGYEIRVGASWDAGTPQRFVQASKYTELVKWGGARTYWIRAIDIKGNFSTPVSVVVTITSPGIVRNQRSEVIDNNALLYWDAPSVGTLPIERYEVRKGSTWAGGSVVGSNGNSTFTAIFEQVAANITYWINAYDSAGNGGTPVSIAATISQPPDYVLRSNIDSAFAGTKGNFYLEGGKMYGPVSTSESWATHFSSRGWNSPQDQITAGYPLYIMPSLTSGYYEEIRNYGATLPATTITVTVNSTLIAGAVTMTPTISWSTDGASWTAGTVGQYSVLAPAGFQYVKVRLDFSCTAGANLIELSALNIKLASKQKTDSGKATITNATTGVVVTFNQAFIDADTPIVQPEGTTPRIPVVDFTDSPNPTSFTVYLYDLAGVKVTGSFSWTARGS